MTYSLHHRQTRNGLAFILCCILRFGAGEANVILECQSCSHQRPYRQPRVLLSCSIKQFFSNLKGACHAQVCQTGRYRARTENCADKMGRRDSEYYDRAYREAEALIGQLRRLFGQEPDGAELSSNRARNSFTPQRPSSAITTTGKPLRSHMRRPATIAVHRNGTIRLGRNCHSAPLNRVEP